MQADHHLVLAWMQLSNRTTAAKARPLPLGLALGGIRPETEAEFLAQVQRLEQGGWEAADPVSDYEAVFSVEHDVRYTGRSWGAFLAAAWKRARLHPGAVIAHTNSSQVRSAVRRTGHGLPPDLLLFQVRVCHGCVVSC